VTTAPERDTPLHGRSAEHLLGQAVEITERVGAHQHGHHLRALLSSFSLKRVDNELAEASMMRTAPADDE
jgi:hypothetical protein